MNFCMLPHSRCIYSTTFALWSDQHSRCLFQATVLRFETVAVTYATLCTMHCTCRRLQRNKLPWHNVLCGAGLRAKLLQRSKWVFSFCSQFFPRSLTQGKHPVCSRNKNCTEGKFSCRRRTRLAWSGLGGPNRDGGPGPAGMGAWARPARGAGGLACLSIKHV